MRARQETSGTLTNLYLQPEDGYLQAGDKEPEGESGKIVCKTGGKKNRLTKKSVSLRTH